MKGRQIAVCGRERGYAEKFAAFANSRKDPLFSVHGFTDCSELMAYTKEHPIDILLLSEECLPQLSERSGFGKVILLSEEEYREEEGYRQSINISPVRRFSVRRWSCTRRRLPGRLAEPYGQRR